MKTEPWVSLQNDCERVYSGINDQSAFAKFQGTSVLITGGTGFLGSWICRFFSFLNAHHKMDIKVYVVARDSKRFLDRIEGIGGLHPEFIRCDVRQLVEIPKDVNYVIHAAGTPDSRYHMSNPLETMAGIGEGTLAVLRAADRVSNLRMIAHLSSGSVYGTQPENLETIDEAHPLVGPRLDSLKSVYTEAKRYAELLCVGARSQLRLPVVVLRPFTFLGPFQSLEAPWAINNFIQDAIMGRPIRILGDGKSVRGFLYGADVAGWILKILVSSETGQIYNVGSSEGFTLQEIAEKVASNFSPRPDIILNASLVPNLPQNRYLASTSKLTTELNLTQYTSLDVAIQRTVEWYKAIKASRKDAQ